MSAEHNHPPNCCCDRITDPDGSRRIISNCPACPDHGDLATPYTEQETTNG
jgi:hypothetical protein